MKCLNCGGQGYREFEGGLIRLRCGKCNGKGEIDDPIGRTGLDNQDAGNKDTGKPRKSYKRKTRKVAAK